MATYQRLTLARRYLIQTLHQQKHTQLYIAQQVGVSQSTISRELAKDRQQHAGQIYQAQPAHQG